MNTPNAAFIPSWQKPGATAPTHALGAKEITKIIGLLGYGLPDEEAEAVEAIIVSLLAKEEERTEYYKRQHKYAIGMLDLLDKGLANLSMTDAQLAIVGKAGEDAGWKCPRGTTEEQLHLAIGKAVVQAIKSLPNA